MKTTKITKLSSGKLQSHFTGSGESAKAQAEAFRDALIAINVDEAAISVSPVIGSDTPGYTVTIDADQEAKLKIASWEISAAETGHAAAIGRPAGTYVAAAANPTDRHASLY